MSDFQYACQPKEGERVSIVKSDGDFRRTMHLPVGLQFHFRFRINLQPWTSQSLTVCVDLLGGFRLQSSRGASVKFMEQGGALFFFERTIDKDPLLDLWLLALGLTPLADAEMEWTDRPSDRLLPLSRFWSGARKLVRPLGGGLDSHYHRSQDKTGWQQQGDHCLQLFPGIKHNGISTAVIVPERGCTQLSLKINNTLLEAELEEISTIADQGIPQTRFRIIREV
jgi:hypothetical protein